MERDAKIPDVVEDRLRRDPELFDVPRGYGQESTELRQFQLDQIRPEDPPKVTGPKIQANPPARPK